jgi:hypothetical protein
MPLGPGLGTSPHRTDRRVLGFPIPCSFTLDSEASMFPFCSLSQEGHKVTGEVGNDGYVLLSWSISGTFAEGSESTTIAWPPNSTIFYGSSPIRRFTDLIKH